MVTVPIYCSTCQQFYQSNAIGLAPGASVRMVGVGSRCPRGHDAEFLEATYSRGTEGGLEILDPTETSREILLKALGIVKEAKAGQLENEEAIDVVKALVPQAAPLIELWQKNNKWAPHITIACLLMLLVWMLNRDEPATVINQNIVNHITINQSYSSEDAREAKAYREQNERSKRQRRRVSSKRSRPKAGGFR